MAQEHLVLRGGVFKTMPTGDVASIEIDPKTFKVYHREIKPEKVVTGFHEVPRWPVKGWVLERWFPVSRKGMTQAEWEAVKSSDGVTPMMGPYPHEGFYFMLGGPFPVIPEMNDLKAAISMHLREEEANPVSYKQMMLNEINADTEREEKAMKKAMDDIAHFYESEVEPILRGTSLEAQRIRNEMQEVMGERSHLGVM